VQALFVADSPAVMFIDHGSGIPSNISDTNKSPLTVVHVAPVKPNEWYALKITDLFYHPESLK
jgi:hypothetical protein